MDEKETPPPSDGDSHRWVVSLIALALVILVWLADWSGPYGPLEAREWYRRHVWPDKHSNLNVITDSPNWSYGEVKLCMGVADPGDILRKKGYEAQDLLNCAGLLPRDEYVTREQFAVTFKGKGYQSQMWRCLKTPNGIVCE